MILFLRFKCQRFSRFFVFEVASWCQMSMKDITYYFKQAKLSALPSSVSQSAIECVSRAKINLEWEWDFWQWKTKRLW